MWLSIYRSLENYLRVQVCKLFLWFHDKCHILYISYQHKHTQTNWVLDAVFNLIYVYQISFHNRCSWTRWMFYYIYQISSPPFVWSNVNFCLFNFYGFFYNRIKDMCYDSKSDIYLWRTTDKGDCLFLLNR